MSIQVALGCQIAPCNKGLQRGLSEEIGKLGGHPAGSRPHGPAWGSVTEKQGKCGGTAWQVLGGAPPQRQLLPSPPLLMLSHRLPLSWPAGSSWPVGPSGKDGANGILAPLDLLGPWTFGETGPAVSVQSPATAWGLPSTAGRLGSLTLEASSGCPPAASVTSTFILGAPEVQRVHGKQKRG